MGQALAVRCFEGRIVPPIGRQNMNDWQSTDLGRGALPRDLSGFEIEAFFTYSESERRVIDDERRSPTLKLALAESEPNRGRPSCGPSRVQRVRAGHLG